MGVMRLIRWIFGAGRPAASLSEQRRRALLAARNAVDFVKNQIVTLRGERDAEWTAAGNYLKAGQKAAAQRALMAVRASDVSMFQLDCRRWLYEGIITRFECIETDQAFAEALTALSRVVSVDPEQMSQALGEAAEKCDVLKDVERIWNRAYDKEVKGFAAGTDIPSVEDMMKSLEDSLAGAKKPDPVRKDPERAPEKKPAEKSPSSAENMAEALRCLAKAIDGSRK